MEETEQRVRKTIEEYHMLEPGDRVIAAVSGGADSVCLLALLCNMKMDMGICLRAVHVHHGLRAEEADRDAEFVRVLCEELDVPCHIIRVDVRGFASAGGMSEEEAGRHLRYEALEREALMWEAELAGEPGAGSEPDEPGREPGARREAVRLIKIAVAHHSDDQAETILHNLFRGTGLGGLKGIPYVRGRIIRPLLDVERREIMSWLKKQGFSWVQDSTNSSDHYTRNRIRCHLLPLIESEVNQGAAGNILRLGRLASQADEYLRMQGECWIKRHVRPEAQKGKERQKTQELQYRYHIPCEAFAAEPEIIRSYVVMEILKSLAGSARDLGWVHVKQVLDLAGRPVGKEVDLPYCLVARKEYEDISVGRSTGGSGGRHTEENPSLPEVKMEVMPYKKGTQFPKNMYTKWFDCDRIKGTPVVRTRRPGDYIVLADGSHKAIKRFMIDEKIPRQLRDQVPLLADGSHIMWVIGYRISEYCKIGPDTVKVLQAEVSGGREEEDSALGEKNE